MKASRRPSGDSAGAVAMSATSVSAWYSAGEVIGRRREIISIITAAIATMAANATAVIIQGGRCRERGDAFGATCTAGSGSDAAGSSSRAKESALACGSYRPFETTVTGATNL